MKKKQLFYPLIWIILLQSVAVSNLYAQLSMAGQSNEVALPNTQVFDFIKYGTVGTSLYTGTVSYSVPVYTYKDKDFELPISLDYASNGYKPNSRGGDLGVGWILNAGGCITREIKGIPDEKMITTTSPNPNSYAPQVCKTLDYRGFMLLHKTNIPAAPDEEFDYVFDGYNHIAFYKPSIGGNTSNIQYESTPDIYHFNFLGISGYFHLWHNQEVKVYCDDPQNNVSVVVDNPVGSAMQFIITAKNGYKYYFGKNSSEEYVQDDKFSIVNYTWKISKIMAPNGRSITFTYSNPSWHRTYTENYQPSSLYYSDLFGVVGEDVNIQQTNITKMYSSPLTKIQISDGVTIDFTYIPTSGEKYARGERGVIVNADNSTKLQCIKVVNSNADILSQCNLAYKISPINGSDQSARWNNAVYFLGEADISGVGKYEFSYNNVLTSYFPILGTYGVDHWGYYNGKNEDGTIKLMNQLSYTPQHDEVIGRDIREPDYNYALYGMLSRIKYPTGGSSLLTYEPHDYSRAVVRNSSGRFFPALSDMDNDKLTGGCRIKTVETFGSDGVMLMRKDYQYKMSNGKSSGILLHTPRYGVKYFARAFSYPDEFMKSAKYYLFQDLHHYSHTHIEYERVAEVSNSAEKQVFYYTNYTDYPDEMLSNIGEPMLSLVRSPNVDSGKDFLNSTHAQYFDYLGSFDYNITNILTPASSFQYKRGKLKSKEIYAGQACVRKELYDYIGYNDFMVDVPIVAGEYFGVFISEYASLWSNNVDIIDDHEIQKNVNYTYNRYGELVNVTTTTSTGDEEVIRYTYATDYVAQGGIYTTMVERNLLSYPVKVEYYTRGADGLEIQTSGKRYTYALFNNLIKPSQLETFNLLTSSWQPETVFNSYDNKGNLTESTDANGITTAYIWGYNGLYLIAKGVNVSYSTLSSHVGTSGLLSGGTTADHSTVRNNCPNALIDFYEYKPLVGLTRHINPSGTVFTYSYNASGKLQSITDENGKLHSEYLYSTDNK